MEETRHWKHPPCYGINKFEEKVTKISRDNQKGLQPTIHVQNSFPDAGEARDDVWSIAGDFKDRHHV